MPDCQEMNWYGPYCAIWTKVEKVFCKSPPAQFDIELDKKRGIESTLEPRSRNRIWNALGSSFPS